MSTSEKSIQNAISGYLEEFNTSRRKEELQKFEKQILSTIVESNLNLILENERFYRLPLKFIIKLYTKMDFSCELNAAQMISKLITKSIEAHPNEKTVILFLFYLNGKDCNFQVNDYLSIFL